MSGRKRPNEITVTFLSIFLIEFVLEDISHKLSKIQLGGKKGVGTEHLIVSLIDIIKMLLDDPEKGVVVHSSYDRLIHTTQHLAGPVKKV